MSLPNFLIIGAAKSGTSAMSGFLSQHPEAHIPFKEPNFFSGWNTRVRFSYSELPDPLPENYVQCGTLDEYNALFSNAGDAKAVGEASVSYLVDPQAALNIHTFLPGMKLIVLLRQPVERAFSHFHYNRRRGREPEKDFSRVIALEKYRLAHGWKPFLCPLYLGHYMAQLSPYIELFPREQFRFYLFEDWNDRPHAVWADLMDFLEISPAFTPDFSYRYAENRVESPVWNMLRRIAPWVKSAVPPEMWRRVRESLRVRLNRRRTLDPNFRHELTHLHFREGILQLQDFLGRDLSHWLV